jgi:CheY-like chemotaxis protein
MGGADQQRDILLAEDNPADVSLLRTAFREYGQRPCHLYSVRDGEETLAFLQREGVYAGMPRPPHLRHRAAQARGLESAPDDPGNSCAGEYAGRDADRGDDGGG